MAVVARWLRHFVRRPPSPPRQFAPYRALTSEASKLLEEENLPWYLPEQFYPVKIGETFNAKYQVVGKLGYGAYSTVWLCRDLKGHRYVALKVCTQESLQSQRLRRELDFYKHFDRSNSHHVGQAYMRDLYDTFEIDGGDGRHLCLVHPPMHMTVRDLAMLRPTHRLNEQLLKITLTSIFRVLDFLHTELNVVYADLNQGNIMLTIDDESMLNDFEKSEWAEPTVRKVIDETRTIYKSRELRHPKDGLWGRPVLCDFGEARLGGTHSGLIQPELYRAPEVLFEMGWSHSVDIWNVGVLIWNLFENKNMFHALDDEHEYNATYHIAEMVAYMGLPPVEYLQRSEMTDNVFDQEGHWIWTGEIDIPDLSFEKSEERMQGENKKLFLEFLRSMLRWMPEERKTARELLDDPWLNRTQNDSGP